MQKELESFFVQPSTTNYRDARNAVVRDPAFRVDYADVLRLSSLLRAHRMAEAQIELDIMLPSWSLSPRIHQIGQRLAVHFGEREDAQLFHFMEQACLDGLCASGQGTLEKPFSTLYPTDALDVLRRLGETPVTQSVQRGEQLLDVFCCQSGRDLAFTVPFVAAAPLRPLREDAAADLPSVAST